MENKDNSTVDCRSEEGVTMGLIDSLISIARVLAQRDFTSRHVQEALKDLAHDEDMSCILRAANKVSSENIKS